MVLEGRIPGVYAQAQSRAGPECLSADAHGSVLDVTADGEVGWGPIILENRIQEYSGRGSGREGNRTFLLHPERWGMQDILIHLGRGGS